MKHKYLNDIGIKSDETCIFGTTEIDQVKYEDGTTRQDRFVEQRKEYGFDERETWSLDYTMIGWLYSHLKMYVEINNINMDYHKVTIPTLQYNPKINKNGWVDHYYDVANKDVTFGEAVDLAINYMRFYLATDIEHEEAGMEQAQCALHIIAEILPCLWW